jgi:kinesin family protein 3/17
MAPPKSKSGENVQVVVRCRPLNNKENALHEQNIVTMDTNSAMITLTPVEGSNSNTSNTSATPTPRMYTFDSVYPPESTQQQVYMETVQPILDSVIKGFNGTIFCYGQTGNYHNLHSILLYILNILNYSTSITNLYSSLYHFTILS